MPNLYIVATPIGNLGDITLRALKILKEVDLILCEDTRQTKKLLNYYGIATATLSYHQHSQLKKMDYISKLLKNGKNLALVSDSGTPLISDPGAKLINYLTNCLNNLKIIPIPGPSALTAALSIAGKPANHFIFLGYPPSKKGRKKFFSKIKELNISPIVLYESVHRLPKTLKGLVEVLGENYELVITKELTKIYEEVFRGSLNEALEHFKGERLRGEFVIIL